MKTIDVEAGYRRVLQRFPRIMRLLAQGIEARQGGGAPRTFVRGRGVYDPRGAAPSPDESPVPEGNAP